MLKDLQWFLDRVGSYILRGTTEVFIPNEEAAQKMFEAQDQKEGYFFTEKIVIHKAPKNDCIACEG